MHPIHRRLLALQREVIPDAEPAPATEREIAAAEARLGRPLPPGYRRFLEEVGACHWPVSIWNVTTSSVAVDWPAWFVPFADDGGGNSWGFDVRNKRTRNLAIDFWDHEEPELESEPKSPTRFEAWLEERIIAGEEELREGRGADRDTPSSEDGESAEDEDLDRSCRLLRHLIGAGMLETTRGFDLEAVADRIVDHWNDPKGILDLLEDRSDVVEIYATEEDVRAAQRAIE